MADKNIAQGIRDEDLWRLIRRFDKQVGHVQSVPRTSQQLDLNRSAEEQFPPAKLQKTIERFYISVIVKFGLFFNHINHLRSWEDPRRTGTFFAVYLVAWLCDRLVPMLTGVLLLMTFSPSTRSHIFPPISEAQAIPHRKDEKPAQATQPNEAHEGEAAEAEAAALVTGLTTSIAEPDEPVQVETTDSGTLAITAGDEAGKPKSSPAISVTLKILNDVTDLCERFSNLLSPTPPFTLIAPRLQIALILGSVCVVSLFLSGHMIVKSVALTIGLAFFGDPVLSRAVGFLDKNIPNWKEYLDIDKTLLKGVPTNAQLTLVLLRIGEMAASPIPAPPPPGAYKDQYPSQWQLWRRRTKAIDAAKKEEDGDDDTSTLTRESTKDSDNTDPSSPDGLKTKIKAKPKKWLRILKFARRAITTAIKGQIAYNRAMALSGAGTKHYAKGLISAVLERNIALIAPPTLSNGPFVFDAKFERKRGTAVIDSSPRSSAGEGQEGEGEGETDTGPILYFTSRASAKLNMEDLSIDSQKSDNIGFQVPISEITELRKTEGLGWKGKLVVQFAAGTEEAANEGLVIKGQDPEKTFHLTDMRGRNQLFNRLVAGGAQSWELH
ncbi:hypothetical protein ASPVEDRAFT_178766 [Aspergillus versicolor CBS 583.65]|uniref:Uncharacterized protein n=1 Tax=Aspergillus versicolor CBS 583.65 TaxID=1036611 RepID=A0A1L9Q299_ASPVE|nr:uncharacterized protein ASPVEDRAFT_178766 [Aspergillus versicolor CBS 583.65]OJJ07859.1 hypothetical protein ASPVEDRAFT_178766 [Aspergillus versicolor CBS 583.65]